MKFGDKLSPEDKETYITSCLVPGGIFHCFCAFTNPPKNKFFVLVAIDPSLIFLINSQISQWLASRPNLRDCQVALLKADHAFLNHDSFLDCTQAERRITIDVLRQEMRKDLSISKGKITGREQEALRYAVKVARTLSPLEKQLIESSFSSTS